MSNLAGRGRLGRALRWSRGKAGQGTSVEIGGIFRVWVDFERDQSKNRAVCRHHVMQVDGLEGLRASNRGRWCGAHSLPELMLKAGR